jgi:DNA-directed RNA polymerase specialized sigma24 family protein
MRISVGTHEERFASVTSAELVAAAKSGRGNAFEGLVERYAGRILCIAQRVAGNKEDAEDIVQKSFQIAYVHSQKFEG